VNPEREPGPERDMREAAATDTAAIWHIRLPDRESAAGLPELLSVLGGFTPAVQALPPDAAVADVAGVLRLFGTGSADLAQRMRVRALALHGLPTVVGIGRSWTVAAMASARPGPDGVRYVAPSRTARFFESAPVGDLYGIRRAQAATLRGYGLETVGQLAAAPRSTVVRILGGRPGRELHERANGIDRRVVVPGRAQQSTGVRADFGTDTLDGAVVRACAARLVADLGTRLRTREQAARAVTVAIRMADRAGLTRTRVLPAPSAHTEDLRETVYRILDGFGLQRARIRRITLTAEDLLDIGRAPTQLTLDRGREARLRAEPVLDALNARYGPGTIGPATAFLKAS
jgi:DNA polymerase-4